jgi:hypothetical protein
MDNRKYKEIIQQIIINKISEETDLYKNTNTFYIKSKDSIYTYFDRKTKQPISYEEYERRYNIYREKLKNTQTNYSSLFGRKKALQIQQKFLNDLHSNMLLNQIRLELFTNTNISFKNNVYSYYDKVSKREISYEEYQLRYDIWHYKKYKPIQPKK